VYVGGLVAAGARSKLGSVWGRRCVQDHRRANHGWTRGLETASASFNRTSNGAGPPPRFPRGATVNTLSVRRASIELCSARVPPRRFRRGKNAPGIGGGGTIHLEASEGWGNRERGSTPRHRGTSGAAIQAADFKGGPTWGRRGRQGRGRTAPGQYERGAKQGPARAVKRGIFRGLRSGAPARRWGGGDGGGPGSKKN